MTKDKEVVMRPGALILIIGVALYSSSHAQDAWTVRLSDKTTVDCIGIGPLWDTVLALSAHSGAILMPVDRIVGIKRIKDSRTGTGAVIGAVVGGVVGLIIGEANQQSHESSANPSGLGDMGLSWVRPTLGLAIGAGSGAIAGVVVGSAVSQDREYSLEGMSLNRKLKMVTWILSNQSD